MPCFPPEKIVARSGGEREVVVEAAGDIHWERSHEGIDAEEDENHAGDIVRTRLSFQ
jgi:hypothetical protein